MKKILVTAATLLEIDGLQRELEKDWKRTGEYHFEKGGASVEILISGIGPALTAFSMGKRTSGPAPDLAIQLGIAGTLNPSIQPGQLVEIRRDHFGFWGARDADNTPLEVFGMGLADPNHPPFSGGRLSNPTPALPGLILADGVTVMETTGTGEGKRLIMEYYPADVETMETASFMYACLQNEWPFHCVRGISNQVGPRDRSSWKIAEALDAVTNFTLRLLEGAS